MCVCVYVCEHTKRNNSRSHSRNAKIHISIGYHARQSECYQMGSGRNGERGRVRERACVCVCECAKENNNIRETRTHTSFFQLSFSRSLMTPPRISTNHTLPHQHTREACLKRAKRDNTTYAIRWCAHKHSDPHTHTHTHLPLATVSLAPSLLNCDHEASMIAHHRGSPLHSHGPQRVCSCQHPRNCRHSQPHFGHR